jgi:hypothetical protein
MIKMLEKQSFNVKETELMKMLRVFEPASSSSDTTQGGSLNEGGD